MVDCFMGSGTVIEAAICLGRRAIGIEKDPRYFWDICVPRCEKATTKGSAGFFPTSRGTPTPAVAPSRQGFFGPTSKPKEETNTGNDL